MRAEQAGDIFLADHIHEPERHIQVADSRFSRAAEAYRVPRARESAESPRIPCQRQDNLGYCLLALDRNAEGLELVHEALDYFERESAVGSPCSAPRPLARYLKADRFEEARFFGESGLARIDSIATLR